jgi:hypothetical protein
MTDDNSIRRLTSLMEEMLTHLHSIAPRPRAVDDHQLYTAEDVAKILGLTNAKTVYDIPETELPRQRVGPRRGSVRFLGIQVRRYIQGLPPLDFVEKDVLSLPEAPGKHRLV